MNLESFINLFKGNLIWYTIAAYLGSVWLGLIIYVWFDVRERVSNILARMGYTLLVVVSGIFGLMLYVLIRPRHSLSESAQRKIEEKLLVKQSIENLCPPCGFVLEKDYIFCPSCSQTLKKVCLTCTRVSQINWPFCPFCSSQDSRVLTPADLGTFGIIKRGPGRPKKLTANLQQPKRSRGRPRKLPVSENESKKINIPTTINIEA